MLTKLIQLKDIKSGMLIKTFQNDQITFKKVIDVWNTDVKEEDRLILEFTNGTKLKCSCNHPIMILANNGIEQKLPRDLTDFDEILTENGSCYLYSLTEETDDISYIDIEVEDTHTFFAASSKEQTMILTHNSQGGVRGGAATLYYPIWHLEVEDLLVLKNNKGTEDNRIRHMDYGVQFNKIMYERLISGSNITLFSPHEVPDLYDAFFVDTDKFRELYEKYERSSKIRKKVVSAIELFSSFMQERKDTGRIYLMNVDHANDHGAFIKELAPTRMSNLCLDGNTKVTIKTNNEEYVTDLEELGGLLLQDSNLQVKSYNIKDNTITFEKVLAFAKTHPAAEVIEIYDDIHDRKIICTPEHLIYTANRGYVKAEDLTADDQLMFDHK